MQTTVIHVRLTDEDYELGVIGVEFEQLLNKEWQIANERTANRLQIGVCMSHAKPLGDGLYEVTLILKGTARQTV